MSEYRVPLWSTAGGITGDTAVVGVRGGVAYDVTYNATAAANWASAYRHRGDGKWFGSRETDGGVDLNVEADLTMVVGPAS